MKEDTKEALTIIVFSLIFVIVFLGAIKLINPL